MNAPLLPARPRLPRAPHARTRAEFPALALNWKPAAPAPRNAGPEHDFLVPNPRPDLTADDVLARMLAR